MAKKRETPQPFVQVVPIEELLRDPGNVRLHPRRNMSAIRSSLRRFGAGRSGVVDGQGVVRAGNGALEAALEEGFREALIVETDGRQLVFVRRPGWSEEEARAYAVTDNRTTDLSEFDYALLAQEIPRLVDAGIELEPLGWQPHELEPLLQAEWGPPAASGDLGAVDTTAVTPPIRVTREEREVFEAAAGALREARGEALTEGQVVALLAGEHLGGDGVEKRAGDEGGEG